MEVGSYPNPTQGIVNLNFGSGFSGQQLKLNVTDAKGVLLIQKQIAATNQAIDLSIFPKGLYLLNLVSSEGETFTQRVVKK